MPTPDQEQQPAAALSAEELDKIEARANAATPGPWIWEDWTQDDGPNEYTLTAPPETYPGWRPDAMFPNLRNKILNDEDEGVSQADRDFIAHAREDIPILLALARQAAVLRDTVNVLWYFLNRDQKAWADEDLAERNLPEIEPGYRREPLAAPVPPDDD